MCFLTKILYTILWDNSNIKISFLLASANHDSTVDYIIEYTHQLVKDIEHEILVCCPDDVKCDKYIKDIWRTGGVRAYNELYKISSGEYIIPLVDDSKIEGSIQDAIGLIESNSFPNQRFKCVTITGNNRSPCGCLGYPYYYIMRFPIIHRSTIEREFNGFFYNPKFKHHFVDNWMGWFIGRNGEHTLELNNIAMVLLEENQNRSESDDYDRNVYYSLIEDFKSGRNTNYV